MPANRSRTLEWRRCLKQVQERQGALEIAVASVDGDDDGASLVWRVRLTEITETQLLVEHPSAMGQAVPIHPGTELHVAFSIGQNRWTFTTKVGTSPSRQQNRSHAPAILHLALPDSVHRSQRRDHDRFELIKPARSASGLRLPEVEIWPLLDPKSVLLAERASELSHASAPNQVSDPGHSDSDLLIPEVGPKFTATLVNLGGGGVGLRISPENNQAVARHKIFWMRMTLGPSFSEPICATCKLVHTHMESTHDTYAGMAFDFSFNPSHQRFVIDQICRYVARQQTSQSSATAISLKKVA